MEFSFDKIANALYIRFSNEKVIDSDEVAEGIIVDYGKDNKIIGLEILNFKKRKLDMNDLIELNAEEIIPKLVQCL
ncbi:MAG: DUF2283 domain-containing protein [Promethearchaeota archaeon]